jgi:mannose-6-phosphate isomerase-like protein (cupin superfamily)
MVIFLFKIGASPPFKEKEMKKHLSIVKSPLVFKGDHVRKTPPTFDGVTLRSYLHPQGAFNDGFDTTLRGTPHVGYSFAHFTIEPGHVWPKTRFNAVEVNYILQGKAEVDIHDETYFLEAGDVIYIPTNTTRSIRVLGEEPLEFLSIMDPAWRPEYEEVVA